MKTKITVDAREAGAGKTRDNIYPQIHKNIDAGERTLVVVPSMLLQDEYKAGLKKTGATSVLIVNDSTADTSVVSAVIEALNDHTYKVVVITQAAFLLMSHEKCKHLFEDLHLIIDEVFEPIDQTVLTNKRTEDGSKKKNAPSVDFKWDEIFDFQELPLDNSEEEAQTYKHVKVREYANESNMLSAVVKELQSTNWKHYITVNQVQSLQNETAESVRVFKAFNLDVFDAFKSVHIAAANFAHTHLAEYLNAEGLHVEIAPGCEFKAHTNSKSKLAFHYPTVREEGVEVPLNLTGNLKFHNKEIMSRFSEVYIEQVGSAPHLILQNSIEDVFKGTRAGTKIKHNAHGLNAHKDKTAIVITSAIRPSADYASFIQDKLKYKTRAEVYTKWATTMFYQAIMRLAIRNPQFDKEITVIIADGVAAKEIIDCYFGGMNVEEHTYDFSDVMPEKKKAGRPKIEKTPEEIAADKKKKNEQAKLRMQAKRAREKQQGEK